MQTIANKLTLVKAINAAAGWTDNELRSLIHGCGGSPKRAKRMLNADADAARVLAEAYSAALAEGTHHVHAVRACNAMYLGMVPAPAAETESGEPDASDSRPDQFDLAAAEAEVVRRAPAPRRLRRGAQQANGMPAPAATVASLKALAAAFPGAAAA